MFVDYLYMFMNSVMQMILIVVMLDVVFDFVGDLWNLLCWVLGFVRLVRVEGDDWIVDIGECEVCCHILVSCEHGIVDFVVVLGVMYGLFMCVVGNGDGS